MTMTRTSKPEAANRTIAKQIIAAYQPKTAEDMQNALKDVFGPMIEEMLKGELDNHLGYSSNDKGSKTTDNRRNGYTEKKIKTSQGETTIKVPRDRDGSFRTAKFGSSPSGAAFMIDSSFDYVVAVFLCGR